MPPLVFFWWQQAAIADQKMSQDCEQGGGQWAVVNSACAGMGNGVHRCGQRCPAGVVVSERQQCSAGVVSTSRATMVAMPSMALLLSAGQIWRCDRQWRGGGGVTK